MASNDIARVYAESLYEAALNAGVHDEVFQEIGAVSGFFEESVEFRDFMLSPSFSSAAKTAFIEKSLGKTSVAMTVNFLSLLIEKDRQGIIVDINSAMRDILDDKNSIKRVRLITSDRLNNEVIASLGAQLEKIWKSKVDITQEIDENIIGGIIIKSGDILIDASLSNSLKRMRQSLLNSEVRSEATYED